VAVPVQDVVEPKAAATVVAVVKAVEPEEATGWAVPEQDVAEAKTAATVVARSRKRQLDGRSWCRTWQRPRLQ
jgi:hypothetical protein